ncbi:hypothetical protein IMZ08_13525 [Bacillus luteolus]|uniref:ATP synthase F0 subunit 8 n=1 Tax=Litchfieldia luteola TaxID=682179 RepID=A0ABR9QKV7_9BACI|nr:hypothetical protein [Cytobacillus luteolus]MBE4909084.1 hypothetical protein [Cytobacillus luteolus]MBP1941940.1 hypothetical protein [Cytobacillus luteolus]
MFKKVDESQMFKRSLQIGLTVSLFFLLVSLFTGQWGFFLWSLLPTFITSTNGYFISKKASQK